MGGFLEPTYSFLCAAAWLGIACAAVAWRPPRPSGATIALLAIAGLTLISGIWGEPAAALRVAPLAGLYAAACYLGEWAPRSLVLLRTAIASIACVAMVARATGEAAPSPGAGSMRMAWPIGYADGLGLVFATGLVLAIGLRPRSPVAAVVCAAALVWTVSRSALLATAVALLALGALRGVVPRRAVVAGAALVVAAAAVLAGPLASRFRDPVPDSRNLSRLLTLSGHGRVELWRSAIHEGVAAPVGGGGAGTWLSHAIRSTHGIVLPANAHSLELEMFAEVGIAGVAALGAFFFVVARRRATATGFALVLAWAVASAVDWDWQLPAATIPAMIAAGAASRTGVTVGRRAGALAVGVAVVVAAAAALHGLGAVRLEHGRVTNLLPWDARQWVVRDPARACKVDPNEAAVLRARLHCTQNQPRTQATAGRGGG